jgi:hypothetical protein
MAHMREVAVMKELIFISLELKKYLSSTQNLIFTSFYIMSLYIKQGYD